VPKVVNTDKARPIDRCREGKEDVKKRGLVVKFAIDCGQPMEDGIICQAELQAFLEETVTFKNPSVRVTLANGGDKRVPLFNNDATDSSVRYEVKKSKLFVSCDVPFSKNYLTGQVKKFLKKSLSRETVNCVPITLSGCALVYKSE
jgi:large subunit ribosomal protein L22e